MYDYRLKLEFNGSGTGLDGLKIAHEIQHSQAPLPVILEGDNKITFAAGVQEGTITVLGNMKSDKTGEKQNTIADYHPTVDGFEDGVKTFRGRGTAIIPIGTPGEITRVRMGVHWRARDAAKDYYEVSASFDGGKEWKSVGKLAQANPAASTYLVFSDVPAGSKEVQVKFEGNQNNTTCIFDLRIDVDYKEPTGGFRPVKITYTWEEGPAVAAAPAATAAPAPAAAGGDAPKEGKKGDKGGDKAAKAGKKGGPPTPAPEMHGTVKTDEHICKTPTDTWTIKCGPNTVPKSYTVELVK